MICICHRFQQAGRGRRKLLFSRSSLLRLSRGAMILWLLALLCGGTRRGAAVQAQVVEPARPEKVTVLIRYQILAERNDRILQYRALMKYLESIGFVDDRPNEMERAEDALDPAAHRLQGTIPSANILRILQHPLVQNFIVAPPGFSFAENPDELTMVRIVLRSGLLGSDQQLLHRQVLERLQIFQFQEALGYDTLQYTQIKGRLAKKFLLALWRDFRDEPTGWFWSATARSDLPRPLADAPPIRWVEVLPAGEIGQRITPPPVEGAEVRWSPELRARLADVSTAEQPLRVEVLFPMSMETRTRQLQDLLDANYAGALSGASNTGLRVGLASVEGVVGNVVTIHFQRASDIKHFSTLVPYSLLLRLPRASTRTYRRVARQEQALPLEEIVRQTGAILLHQRGYRGKGVRVVLLVTDLEGVSEQVGKTLPPSTHWIDLTSELNPDLQPLPVTAPPEEHNGLILAQALAAVAPEAELILVRIDPNSLFQVAEVVRWLRDRDYISPALHMRGREIERQIPLALERKQQAIQKRQQVLQKPDSEENLRQLLHQSQAELQAAETAVKNAYARYDRYLLLRQQLQSLLRGADVLVNPWVWDAGYPVDGCSPLSQQVTSLLTRQPPRIISPTRPQPIQAVPPPVWIQAASVAPRTVWAGRFRDDNTNNFLEFAPPDQPLPKRHWSRELNFLAWHTEEGEELLDLPAGCTVRCTLQWREPLDPQFPDLSRPLYPVTLHLWKQLDPTGQKQASDEMSEVARTVAGPYPIYTEDGSVVYEQILEYRVEAAGRYAVVVGMGERPPALLTALQRQVEIYARLMVDTLPPLPGRGHVVLHSFASTAAGVGLPGDIAETITIGTESAQQLHQGGPSIPLRRKPDYLLPDSVAWATASYQGTAMGTVISGGIAVLLRQAGVMNTNPFRTIGVPDGSPLRLPEAWLHRLPAALRQRD